MTCTARDWRTAGVWAALLLSACGHAGSESNRDVGLGKSKGTPVSQAELQQDIQRFTSTFLDRIVEQGEPLAESDQPELRQAALKRVLLYSTGALEIATGAYPEINTVDMIVFVTLAKGALERYWIPEKFGSKAAGLLNVFTESERDLWAIAAKVLDAEQSARVRKLIADWQAEHPTEYRVEGVRFKQFARRAGTVSAQRAKEAGGLFGDVKAATQQADQAVLLGERSVFLAQRMPFLIRLQARIGVQEMLSDSLSHFENTEALFQQIPRLQPLLTQLGELTASAGSTVHEARLLAAAGHPYLDYVAGTAGAPEPGAQAPEDETERVAGHTDTAEGSLPETLDSANQLAAQSLAILRELRGALPKDPERALAAAELRLDHNIRRWSVYLLLVGLGWAVFYWSGHIVATRLTAAWRARDLRARRRSAMKS